MNPLLPSFPVQVQWQVTAHLVLGLVDQVSFILFLFWSAYHCLCSWRPKDLLMVLGVVIFVLLLFFTSCWEFFFFPVDSHPTLDLSDFPSLSSRSSVAPNPVPANRTYGRLFECLFMSTQAYLYFSTGIIKEIIVEKKTWELY